MGSRFLMILILSVAASRARAQDETLLYTFTGGSDGGVPYASLVADGAGNLYGSASQYGDSPCTFPYDGCGTVFELTPTRDGWNFEVLYAFQGGRDGASPSSALTLDASGALYGTTIFGGVGCGGTGCGTVFELKRSPAGWKESILHRFTGGSDGNDPLGAVVLDKSGNLYGTAAYGGDTNCFYEGPGCGVVFELTPSGDNSDGWTETVLHTFSGSDGADPLAGVTLDGTGDIFGVTSWGGNGAPHTTSGGVVFGLTRSGRDWTENTIYEFPQYNGNPASSLVLDRRGNLYGVTEHGGVFGVGSVFELKKSSLGAIVWAETDIHDFAGPPDGWAPLYSAVVFDKAGNLYGTTQAGGTSSNCQTGCGTVFELTNVSGDTWEETQLFSFTGGPDGFYPFSGVIVDNKGRVYGMTPNGGNPNCTAFSLSGCGVVFRISN